MIYLDNGATSLHKPAGVKRAMVWALEHCGNPGRGGHEAARLAAQTVYAVRETASELFDCQPEQVVFTGNCTHGLNLAIESVVKPGAKVVISGFEHNAVTRPLHARKCRIVVAGRKLFSWEDTLADFEHALREGVDAAVVTHMSNVFGYILPVEEIGMLCRQYGVPLIVDAAQSAGSQQVSVKNIGADFIAMPGHKGLLGPQGTGLLLCARELQPLLYGGTGSESRNQDMPQFLPDRAEAGTLNVPGIAGLGAGLRYLRHVGVKQIGEKERRECQRCVKGLESLGLRVFSGAHQGGTVSFLPGKDCEEAAQYFSDKGIALRPGLHCAPLAHESAGTIQSGTLRVSFGHAAQPWETDTFVRVAAGFSKL